MAGSSPRAREGISTHAGALPSAFSSPAALPASANTVGKGGASFDFGALESALTKP